MLTEKEQEDVENQSKPEVKVELSSFGQFSKCDIYELQICDKKYIPTLCELPDDILQQLMRYLTLEQVVSLGGSCKMLEKFCNSATLWKRLYFEDFGVLREVQTEMQSGSNSTLEKLEESPKVLYINHIRGFHNRKQSRMNRKIILEYKYARERKRIRIKTIVDNFAIRAFGIFSVLLWITFIVFTNLYIDGLLNPWIVVTPLLLWLFYGLAIWVLNIWLYRNKTAKVSSIFGIWQTHTGMLKTWMEMTMFPVNLSWVLGVILWCCPVSLLCSIAMKLNGNINVWWSLVLLPLHLFLMILCIIAISRKIRGCAETSAMWGDLVTYGLVFSFVVTLGLFLDNIIAAGLSAVFIPIWILNVLSIVYPVWSHYSSGETDRHSEFFVYWGFALCINSPLFVFEVMLCLVVSHSAPFSTIALFTPLYVWSAICGVGIILSSLSFSGSYEFPEEPRIPGENLDINSRNTSQTRFTMSSQYTSGSPIPRLFSEQGGDFLNDRLYNDLVGNRIEGSIRLPHNNTAPPQQGWTSLGINASSVSPSWEQRYHGVGV